MNKGKGRLVILSGPSCVGKSPLDRALTRFYPDLRSRLQSVILYNSRAPRPGESDGRDYYFRHREYIEALRDKSERFIILDVRGDLQALDIRELESTLASGDAFFEGNPFVGRALQTHPNLKDVPSLSVFMAPLSRAEIMYLKKPGLCVDLVALVTDIMRRKLLRRTRRQKSELSLADLENIEKRAGSAYTELKEACFFDHVIPNHDGEDSENWNAFYYPLGDARIAMNAFVDLLQGKGSASAEHWEPDLII